MGKTTDVHIELRPTEQLKHIFYNSMAVPGIKKKRFKSDGRANSISRSQYFSDRNSAGKSSAALARAAASRASNQMKRGMTLFLTNSKKKRKQGAPSTVGRVTQLFKNKVKTDQAGALFEKQKAMSARNKARGNNFFKKIFQKSP